MALSDADLTACYRDLNRRLYNVLYRLLWNPQDCQDVMHDAFMKVWHQRGDVHASTLEGLVFATALNLARNQLRWRSLRSFVGIDEVSPAHGSAEEDAPAIRQALERLPQAQKQVLLLSEIGGFSTREIAAILRIPEGTVGSRKHLALQRMREHLE